MKSIARLKYDGSYFSYYKNSVNPETTVSGTVNNTLIKDDLFLMSRAGSGIFGGGDVYEILIFDEGLSDGDVIKINHYLSKKWGLESSMDSDGDGYSDADESLSGTLPMDPSDYPVDDFSDIVDAEIGVASGFDSIEDSLKLWLDASNIDGDSNASLANGDTVTQWVDLSGNGYSLNAVNTPVLVTDGFNGYPAIEFESTHLDAFRTNGIGDDLLGGKSEFDIFIVCKLNSSSNQTFLAINDGDQSTGYAASGFYLNLYSGYVYFLQDI